MKYIKKPLVIEAEQYTKYGKLVTGMCNSQSCFVAGNDKPHVHTIHANQIVNLEIGDFVIPEMDGEHYYPCKPDIFAMTYEPVGVGTKRRIYPVNHPRQKAWECPVSDMGKRLTKNRDLMRC